MTEITNDNVKVYLENYFFKYKKNNIKDLELDFKLKEEYEEFKKSQKKYSNNSKSIFLIEYYKKNLDYLNTKKFLENEYFVKGYGIKWIAKNLNVTYSIMRSIFNYFDIQIRKGRDVYTENTKKFRKQKAVAESNLKTGWASYEAQRKIKAKSINRGIQGYFYNSSKKELTWLRSSHEYIFADWLNHNNINWDSEVETFKLDEQTNYRPDFFIYDENWKLIKIVEIKGYWQTSTHKVEKLRNFLEKIEVILIENDEIKNYIVEDVKLGKKIKIWKQIRILKK